MVKGWSSKKIILIAIMSATLEVGKLALSIVANVEVVSLLIAVYGYVFGLICIYSVLVFIVLECLVWGINSWVISYIIYWNLLCFIFVLLGKNKIESLLIIVFTITILTFIFGIITSLVDVAFFGFNNYFKIALAYYLQGIWFYVVHIISNSVLFFALFNQLKNTLNYFKTKYFKQHNKPLI